MINKREDVVLKHHNDSNNIYNIYENNEEYNPNKECKIFTVFDYMIADMLSNNKLHPIVMNYLLKVEN